MTKFRSIAHWADGRLERLPKLAAELVALQVAAIVGNIDATRAAKAATASIPIIFVSGADPVACGAVSECQSTGRQYHRRQLLYRSDYRQKARTLA